MTNDPNGATGEAVSDAEHRATKEIAALDFEPWTGSPAADPPPENTVFIAESLGYMPAVRSAHLIMFRTKAEMVDACGQNEDSWLDMIECITSAKLFFTAYADLLKAAEVRALIVASAVALKGSEASR